MYPPLLNLFLLFVVALFLFYSCIFFLNFIPSFFYIPISKLNVFSTSLPSYFSLSFYVSHSSLTILASDFLLGKMRFLSCFCSSLNLSFFHSSTSAFLQLILYLISYPLTSPPLPRFLLQMLFLIFLILYFTSFSFCHSTASISSAVLFASSQCLAACIVVSVFHCIVLYHASFFYSLPFLRVSPSLLSCLSRAELSHFCRPRLHTDIYNEFHHFFK